MSHVRHSDEIHAELLARIPEHTGRDLASWFGAVEDGPALLNFDERVNWMRDEHDLPLGYAQAIVREHDLVRAARRTG
jgi:hypothetical protein